MKSIKFHLTIFICCFWAAALAQTCEKTQIKDPILIDAIGRAFS